MSKYSNGTLVYGVVVKDEDFVAFEKTFAHDYPGDYKFDPKTGRELWRQCDSIADRVVGTKLDTYSNGTRGETIVGLKVAGASDFHDHTTAVAVDPAKLGDLEADAYRLLAEQGIADKGRDFGLYLVAH